MILCKISSPVSEVFQGELTYTTKCSNGHSINEETNPFWTLHLSLRNNPDDKTYNVGSSYTCFFEPKSFSGDNMVYCNTCNEKTQAKSVCNMVTFPQILTLLLRRFDFDYNKMSHFKSDCCVAVPLELPQLENQNNNYELYGIVNHMGSLRGGHYTATIRSNDSWYTFNDDVVKAEGQPFAESKIFESRDAYLLMYRLTDTTKNAKPCCEKKKNEEGKKKEDEVEKKKTKE
ncbi:ubiquitin carboxyl-terminal hydrolase 47, partial [Etheostoma spectabile]|uniref:ubiquitin carboxyl-terminal hydrolase 47 n=1 Tax=Etheostoma spectabile TaxID=54343 RepID=UPI0013AEB338